MWKFFSIFLFLHYGIIFLLKCYKSISIRWRLHENVFILSTKTHRFFNYTTSKASVIYIMLNKKNVNENAFNALMTLLKIPQNLLAGIFKRNVKKPEFMPRTSELIERSSWLLTDKCQFKLTEPKKIIILHLSAYHKSVNCKCFYV